MKLKSFAITIRMIKKDIKQQLSHRGSNICGKLHFRRVMNMRKRQPEKISYLERQFFLLM